MSQKHFDIWGDITIVISPSLKIRNINKSIFNFLLFTEEELIGNQIQNILPEYPLEQLISGDSEYIPYRDTFLINKNGDRSPISVSASSIKDEDGSLLALVLLLHEVSGRNQKKTTLADMESRYRSLTDNALDAVIVMNHDGMVIEWNLQAEAQFGWLSEEAIGSNLADLIIPPAMRERHQQGLNRFIQTGERRILNKRIELSALHREGYLIPVELTVSPIPWGDTYIFSAFVRDITSRKLSERELVQAKEAAEAAARSKSLFLATMSHEIRTPLNGIVGMTQLLKDTELSLEQEMYMEHISKSENALLAIINDILDFTKIDSGNVELEWLPFNLAICIEETFDLLSGLAADKRLDLNYVLDPDLPQKVVGDMTRLRQVLINLIGNAIKFTNSGGVSLRVDLMERIDPKQYQLLFTVKDTGIGIPSDQMGLLFKPFSQVDSSTTRKFGGTGLGLAICKNLVELMGGEIWAEPVQEGATFVFTITTHSADSWTSHQEMAAFDSASDRSSIRVLIAEDNEINQKVLIHLLQKEGINADVVTNGIEVLEAFELKAYELVLMDIQMPIMDGIEATQTIRQTFSIEKQPKIIAVTSNAFTEDKEKCMAAGMDGYISKPIRRTELLSALNNIL
ncbi:PAS domain S-box protein [Paenibacillus sp. LHD-38]|uniref:PAS domain S-box protein n=1 Tax=Paenibacillus sp. LHD-38 TaxID=3072143 RepID=UPI00280E220C|nr:PAS domain S-box protein [Paenibacillus sp. LHD-38]MDQ8733582.1 PAS domain S-box protein [Paenibacillus sp. LHD-38]